MPQNCNYGKLCLWLWNGKRIEHLLLERLDNLIEIEIDSKPETDNAMGDSLTFVNRLYEESKLKQVKNEVLHDLRNELKTIISLRNPVMKHLDISKTMMTS